MVTDWTKQIGLSLLMGNQREVDPSTVKEMDQQQGKLEIRELI